MFRFALCADDYALTRGVSRGILELLGAGRVTAVSALVTGRGWAEEAGALRQFADIADIGLHLNLTLGTPLGAMPALAPSNRFPALGSLVRSALLGRLPAAEIAAEAARQIDSFVEHFGRLPDYVDGHQHVHALPVIRDALLGTVAERRLAGRLWLRDPGDRLHGILARPLRGKALAVAALTAGFAPQAAAKGFAFNDGFSGFSNFNPSRDYATLFAASLRSPGPRHLVMCHPGYSDAALADLDPATASRDAELAFLLSPAFSGVLADRSAGLTRLSVVLHSH
jgi:predicted glycoside hydrolase/deacetylase ChbG (UPF0249 family)